MGTQAITQRTTTFYQQILILLGLLTVVSPLQGSEATEAHSASAKCGIGITVNATPASTPLPEGADAETGFRMQRYRSPVPSYLPGAETVSTKKALQLHSSGKVTFIDVYPPKGLGPDPLDGHWIISETHDHIEKSTWLPEVGRGYLDAGRDDYFKRNLSRITSGDKSTPLLFYCTADCWQSWNAARRALPWGYENIFWYPDGTDGWTDEDHPLVAATPVNFLEP